MVIRQNRVSLDNDTLRAIVVLSIATACIVSLHEWPTAAATATTKQNESPGETRHMRREECVQAECVLPLYQARCTCLLQAIGLGN